MSPPRQKGPRPGLGHSHHQAKLQCRGHRVGSRRLAGERVHAQSQERFWCEGTRARCPMHALSLGGAEETQGRGEEAVMTRWAAVVQPWPRDQEPARPGGDPQVGLGGASPLCPDSDPDLWFSHPGECWSQPRRHLHVAAPQLDGRLVLQRATHPRSPPQASGRWSGTWLTPAVPAAGRPLH